MNFVGHPYYNVYRILLSSIGLWPYQDPRMKKIQIVISSIILVSSVIIQLMKFITTEYSLNLLLKILSFAIPCMVFILKYVSFCMGIETVKDLMENVISDWNLLKTEIELEIIKKYSNFGRFYTTFLALAAYSAFFVYILIQFTPNFLDIVAPQNESRLHRIPLPTAEYFVDQQKYYLPILLHINVIALVGFTTVISTESLFTAYAQHAIGMFEIARFTKFLTSSFTTSYFFLTCLGVTSLTANLVRLFLIVQYLDDLEECLVAVLIILGHICYTFMGNHTGQRLIDHSTDVFRRTYISQWYVAPPHAQKLLLFMMQQSIKGTTISIGGIFVPSLEGFATITSMSLSYFAVIRSV